MKEFTCVLVDDDPWTLIDLRSCIEQSGFPFRVEGEARSAEQALTLIGRLSPDLVITDICMGGMSGLDMLEECRKNHCGAEFVILSGFLEFEYARRAMKSSVHHYLAKPISLHEVKATLQSVYMSLSGQTEGASGQSDGIEQILDYLRKNIDASPSLGEVADRFHLSHPYFSEMFKRETGKSFVQYKNELRMERAKKLLVETKAPVSEISLFCGFANAAYFCAMFKQLNDITPQQYRALHHQGGETP